MVLYGVKLLKYEIGNFIRRHNLKFDNRIKSCFIFRNVHNYPFFQVHTFHCNFREDFKNFRGLEKLNELSSRIWKKMNQFFDGNFNLLDAPKTEKSKLFQFMLLLPHFVLNCEGY